MENKRGQGMSTSTIILLILGLIILVVLILGFTLGWQNFAPWLSSNNVDKIVTACGVACSTDSQYDFCSVLREVRDGTNEKFDATCFQLSDPDGDYADRNYGVAECATITCD